jgi:hypothetical protein
LVLTALLMTAGLFEPAAQPGKPLKLRVEVVNPELRRQGVQLAHPQSLFTWPAPDGRR